MFEKKFRNISLFSAVDLRHLVLRIKLPQLTLSFNLQYHSTPMLYLPSNVFVTLKSVLSNCLGEGIGIEFRTCKSINGEWLPMLPAMPVYELNFSSLETTVNLNFFF